MDFGSPQSHGIHQVISNILHPSAGLPRLFSHLRQRQLIPIDVILFPTRRLESLRYKSTIHRVRAARRDPVYTCCSLVLGWALFTFFLLHWSLAFCSCLLTDTAPTLR